MTVWTRYVTAAVAAFLWLETRAIRGDSPTLTQYARHRLGVDPKAGHYTLSHTVFVGFIVWLYGHLFLGWGPSRSTWNACADASRNAWRKS